MAKQKRMTKAELRAPDEVEVVLQNIWDRLLAHWKVIAGAVAVLLVGGIVFSIMGSSSQSSKEANSLALYDATRAIGGSTGEEPQLPPELGDLPMPPHFDSEEARVGRVESDLKAYLDANKGSAANEVALIAYANAQLNANKADDALTTVKTWLEQYANSPAEPLVRELKARIELSKGERDSALKTLNALAADSKGHFKGKILAQIGDLQNPSLNNNGEGDAEAAKKAYEEALKVIPEGDGGMDSFSIIAGKPGLRGRIEARMGLLL